MRNAIRLRIGLAVVVLLCTMPQIWLLCRDYPSVLRNFWEEGWLADPLASISFALMAGMMGGAVSTLLSASRAWYSIRAMTAPSLAAALQAALARDRHAVVKIFTTAEKKEDENGYW